MPDESILRQTHDAIIERSKLLIVIARETNAYASELRVEVQNTRAEMEALYQAFYAQLKHAPPPTGRRLRRQRGEGRNHSGRT